MKVKGLELADSSSTVQMKAAVLPGSRQERQAVPSEVACFSFRSLNFGIRAKVPIYLSLKDFPTNPFQKKFTFYFIIDQLNDSQSYKGK